VSTREHQRFDLAARISQVDRLAAVRYPDRKTLAARMLLNVVVPTGLTSGRALFTPDWITVLVMVIIAVVGAVYFLIARPDRRSAATCTTSSSQPAPSAKPDIE
jgi:hypothetical protein